MRRSIFKALRFSISVFSLASILFLPSIRYALFVFPCSFFHQCKLLNIYSFLLLGILRLGFIPLGYSSCSFFCRILSLISFCLSTFCYFLSSFLQYLLLLLIFLYSSLLLLGRLRMRKPEILFHQVQPVNR